MYIESSGIHRGSLQIAQDAYVYTYNGSVIDFTVAERNASEDYLINDLSLIWDAPTYTITVSADQKDGTYKLAQGAENFSGSITIGDGTVDYGTLTANGGSIEYNGTTYELDLSNGNLTLTIGEEKIDAPAHPSGLARLHART